MDNPLSQLSFIDSFHYGDESENEKYYEIAEKKRQEKTSADAVSEAIRKNASMLSEKYPRGGIRSSRVIDSRILLSAPEGYFNKYLPQVTEALAYVQGFMAQLDISDSVNKAKGNPTDDDSQEDAYRIIHRGITEFYERGGGALYGALDRLIVSQMVVAEIIGFSVLDPLWRDKRITEIICNGPYDIQAEYRGIIRQVKSVSFKDYQHLQNLIDRLYAAINRTVSPVNPLRKGRLPDNSRMMVTHRTVSPDGPNVNIRRHPEEFWTPEDLIYYNSASKELLTEIGNYIYKGCSYILSGGTSTGKTSTLNALTGFYRDNLRMLTLEDNLEMKPNPHKLWAAPLECNEDTTEDGRKVGVSMRDLVKAALQMRPDGIIIGEVTDGAMYDLCQALNTGHFGASTVHANDEKSALQKIVSLISQADIISDKSILPVVSDAFDFIIQLEYSPIDGSRRMVAVAEILPDQEVNLAGEMELRTNLLWKFEYGEVDYSGDKPKVTGQWVKVGEMSERRKMLRHLHLERDLTWEELKKLSSIEGATVSDAKNL